MLQTLKTLHPELLSALVLACVKLTEAESILETGFHLQEFSFYQIIVNVRRPAIMGSIVRLGAL